MRARVLIVGVSVLSFLGIAAASALACWIAGGVPVCKAPKSQIWPGIAADGKGGAILTWLDQRWMSGWPDSLYYYSIGAQRIDADGNTCWSGDGVRVSHRGHAHEAAVVPDGEGGAVITWIADRLLAQRFDANGAAMWPGEGIAICEYSDRYSVISDGAGGIIVAYNSMMYPEEPGRVGTKAQWIKGDGSFQWDPEGVTLCSRPYITRMTTDGGGGAIVVWADSRAGYDENDIYCQRIAANGTVCWQTEGVAVCTAPDLQMEPQIASDEEGGAIVAWIDCRSNHLGDIFVQRLNKDGTALWAPGGIRPYSSSPREMDRRGLVAASDGVGGVFLAWEENCDTCMNWNIYAQRIDAAGRLLFKETGSPVCVAIHSQMYLSLTSDGAGGQIISWLDYRENKNQYGWGAPVIYAQRISGAGEPVWIEGGVRVALPRGGTTGTWSGIPYPRTAPDGMGGVMIAWHNGEEVPEGSVPGYDIYAVRLTAEGELPPDDSVADPPDRGDPHIPMAESVEIYPNPFNPGTRVRYRVDVAARVEIAVYDIAGRLVQTLASGFAKSGEYEISWNGRDRSGAIAASGIYFCRLAIGDRITTKRLVLIR